MGQSDEKTDYKKALLAWAERNNVTPVDFAEKTGYSYMHAWSLLRGKAKVTADALGPIMVGYGVEAVSEIIAEVGGGE